MSLCLFCRHICYYCSLQGHTAIYRSSFDFAGALPLQKGLSLLKSWSHLCLSPNTWVPPLSEEVLGWAADMVSHRWNELPTGMSTHRRLLICEMKAKAQLFLYMSSCICWEVSPDFFQRLCELRLQNNKSGACVHATGNGNSLHFWWIHQKLSVSCWSLKMLPGPEQYPPGAWWTWGNGVHSWSGCSNQHFQVKHFRWGHGDLQEGQEKCLRCCGSWALKCWWFCS